MMCLEHMLLAALALSLLLSLLRALFFLPGTVIYTCIPRIP